MPRVTITEAVQVGGSILIPGEQELSKEQIDTLKRNGRGHLIQSAGEVDEGETPVTPEEASKLLAEFPELVEAGYTVETARAASDEELMALPKVGRATVRRLREALA